MFIYKLMPVYIILGTITLEFRMILQNVLGRAVGSIVIEVSTLNSFPTMPLPERLNQN